MPENLPLSPLTGRPQVKLVQEIPCDRLIQDYQKQLRIDIRPYLQNSGTIQLFQCLETGLRFYAPASAAGDDSFYQALGQCPWYYMPWKWEHQITLDLTGPHKKVLEIGCGQGDFLAQIKQKNINGTGLELNTQAVSKAREAGLTVHKETIEEHAEHAAAQYDLVCAFQVLEHIPGVKNFLEASIKTLKPGGQLVISVPNNNLPTSPVLQNNILDMPPHHMNLWDSAALANIAKIFPLSLEKLLCEPLQKYHHRKYHSFLRRQASAKYGILGGLASVLAYPVIEIMLTNLSPYLTGHTILALYTRTENTHDEKYQTP